MTTMTCDDSLPAVLRRRYHSLKVGEGFNEEFCRAIKRAAEEIERLTQERDNFRAALDRIVHIGPLGVDTYPEVYRRMREIALAALGREENP